MIIQNITHQTKDPVTRNPLKTGVLLRFSGRISNSCFTCDIRRISLVTNPVIVINDEKDRIVITTNGTYPWSFVMLATVTRYIYHMKYLGKHKGPII